MRTISCVTEPSLCNNKSAKEEKIAIKKERILETAPEKLNSNCKRFVKLKYTAQRRAQREIEVNEREVHNVTSLFSLICTDASQKISAHHPYTYIHMFGRNIEQFCTFASNRHTGQIEADVHADANRFLSFAELFVFFVSDQFVKPIKQ